jgi:hypothetical protein
MTGIVDGVWACVLAIGFYDSTFASLWQSVASTVVGKEATQGGATTVALGIVMHFGVALFWSGLFLLLLQTSSVLRRWVARPGGAFAIAAVYGPFVWAVMSLVVIPALVHRAPTVTGRWWIQLAGHAFFVGLPIVLSLRPQPRPAGDVALAV